MRNRLAAQLPETIFIFFIINDMTTNHGCVALHTWERVNQRQNDGKLAKLGIFSCLNFLQADYS